MRVVRGQAGCAWRRIRRRQAASAAVNGQSPDRLYLEVQPLAFLEASDDLEEVARLRIAVRTEHAHQALGRLRGQPTEFPKTDGRVDIVAQNRLSDVDLAGEKALHTFLEQSLPEARVALEPLPDRHSEIARQWHGRRTPQHRTPTHGNKCVTQMRAAIACPLSLTAERDAADSTYYSELPPERFPAMLERLELGLEEGALGIGLAVQYYPGGSRREIVEVFRFAGEKRATIHPHVRSMTIEAMQEVLANAVATGAPLHIVHVNSMALGEIDTVLGLIGGARRLGLDVTTEAYPYTAGSTSLHSSIFDEGWQGRLGIDYGDLQWEATGERLTRETFERYRRERGTVILGTYSRVLGRYVRERSTLDLMNALLKMTLLPADRVASMSEQMRRKGRIQVGADADIVVFDPDTVIDTATFEGGLSFSEGIVHTMVNGVFMVRDGETVEGVAPGRAIVGRFGGEP